MSTDDSDSRERFKDAVEAALSDLRSAQSELHEAQRLGDKYDISDRSIVSDSLSRVNGVADDLARLSDSSRGGSSCFPASALVATPYGDRRIASFEVGDAVLSWSPAARRLVEHVVTRVLVHAPCEFWRVRIEYGRDIVTTPNHRFLTSRGWVRADRLRPGDTLVRPNGDAQAVPVLAIESGARHEAAYNLFTNGEHSFMVDGFVVHNFSHLRALRTWWHRLALDHRAGHRTLRAKADARPTLG